MKIRVTHETRYDYASPVEMAQHVAYLRPLDTPWQAVHEHRLTITPAQDSEADATSLDVYGNHRAFFSLHAPHDELSVVAQTVLSTKALNDALPNDKALSEITWEALRDQFRYHAGAPWSAATEFSFPSPRVPRHEAFAAYARPSFAPGVSALQAARDLMHRIHADFKYETNSTEVHTPALKALEMRHGVCQDFAHIMLACLRSMGLAARYVSGYLLTTPPPGQKRLVGSDASHAWASVWLPDLDKGKGGWHDLDPTNDRDGQSTPGEDYITLATGRDYSDVTPLRGVIHGGGQHSLKVAVTVMPQEEA